MSPMSVAWNDSEKSPAQFLPAIVEHESWPGKVSQKLVKCAGSRQNRAEHASTTAFTDRFDLLARQRSLGVAEP